MSIQDRMNDFEPEDASPCNTCARRKTATSCEAFEGIPMVFITGDNDHRKPYFGDNGLQYKAKKRGR